MEEEIIHETMKENSIYVDSLISNFKKKKYWIECIDINRRPDCFGMFESGSKTRLRCPNCLIENKKEKGKKRQIIKAKLLKKKEAKKQIIRPPKKCIGCKRVIPCGRSTYCSVECRIKNTTGYIEV